ncbi:hypothetical protein [Alicyclobacillus sp. ALC3]|uniref:hypothetical protein n=1 Tax=Alicyclobacillus sp. ALC3 TaxID=2796143 RepID=UPI00237835BA|nr:hypothetical protein [Alicyclobacillus sp. ALC3]WDL96381.1 hypothetical protein JC200_18955 [Alicyclobacillus sp. ALC3]
MTLSERLTEIAEELEGPGLAESAVVARYIRDELIPLAEDEDTEIDVPGVMESLQEINEHIQWVCGRLAHKGALSA